MSNAPPQPILQALLVADRVYRDESGKCLICGTFNNYIFSGPQAGSEDEQQKDESSPTPVEESPSEFSPYAAKQLQQFKFHQTGSAWIYLSVSEIHGEAKLELRYVSLSDEKVFSRAEFRIEIDDPLQVVEVFFPWPQIPHIPGHFAFELVHNDVPLGCYRITVSKAQV